MPSKELIFIGVLFAGLITARVLLRQRAEKKRIEARKARPPH